MTTEVIIAGMSLLGTLAGSFGGIYVSGSLNVFNHSTVCVSSRKR